MIKLLSEMLRLLQAQERKNNEPEPEPEPFKPEPIPKNETYMQMLQRRTRDDVRAGRAVTMNSLARSVPNARPPRAPGQQFMRSNGRWWWWS